MNLARAARPTLVLPMSPMGLAGVHESLGGVAIGLGRFTRRVVFVLWGGPAVAYLQAYQPHGMWPIPNHGEAAVPYPFDFRFVAANGAGGLSLDALRHRGRS